MGTSCRLPAGPRSVSRAVGSPPSSSAGASCAAPGGWTETWRTSPGSERPDPRHGQPSPRRSPGSRRFSIVPSRPTFNRSRQAHRRSRRPMALDLTRPRIRFIVRAFAQICAEMCTRRAQEGATLRCSWASGGERSSTSWSPTIGPRLGSWRRDSASQSPRFAATCSSSPRMGRSNAPMVACCHPAASSPHSDRRRRRTARRNARSRASRPGSSDQVIRSSSMAERRPSSSPGSCARAPTSASPPTRSRSPSSSPVTPG